MAIVKESGDIDRMQRVLVDQLGRCGENTLYLKDFSSLDKFYANYECSNGQLIRHDGPATEILRHGGTLIVNGPRLAPHEKEAFNTLIEHQTWAGQTLPCKTPDRPRPVRVIYLFDEKEVDCGNSVSEALESRLETHDLKDFPLSRHNDFVLQAAQPHPDATVIDLRHDQDWEKYLFGAIAVDHNGQPVQASSALSMDAEPGKLVLRNPPDDAYLTNTLHQLKQRGWQVILETLMPAEELEPKIRNKQPAGNIEQLLKRIPHPPVYCVGPSNLTDVVEHQHIVVDKRLVRQKSLVQIHKETSDETPVLYVASALSPTDWDRLMQTDSALHIAVAHGIRVPKEYSSRIHFLQELKFQPQKLSATLPNEPVSFIFSTDPALTDRVFLRQALADSNVTRLYPTPQMRGGDILHKIKVISQEAANASRLVIPEVERQTHQLIQDLQDGHTVIVENPNPQLVRDMAPLLQPPYELRFDGKCFHFGDRGGLTGKLIILTKDRDIVEQHVHTPAYVDQDCVDRWQKQAGKALCAAFPDMDPAQIQQRLNKVLEFFETAVQQKLLPKQQPPIGYSALENLFRRHFVPGPEAYRVDDADLDSPQAQERQLFALVKDALIERQPTAGEEEVEEATYEQLKAWLKVCFPDKLKCDMLPRSVNIDRLQVLWQGIKHSLDISSTAKLSWHFLNTFNPAVIEEALFESGQRCPDEEIGRRVLSLVLDQVQAQIDKAKQNNDLDQLDRWRCTPMLEEALRQRKPSGGDPLPIFQRLPSQDRAAKNAGKIRRVLDAGAAPFLQGAPGTGKSHVMREFGRGSTVYELNINEDVEQEFADTQQAWAEDDDAQPKLLEIDEANLAVAGALNMLKGYFRGDKTLYVNGKIYSLTERHRMILTGNANKMAGRTVQEVIQESFVPLQFKTLPLSFLRQAFVAPLLDSATPHIPALQQSELADYVADTVLDIHLRLQAFSKQAFSPRNMEEHIIQVLCMLATDPNLVTSAQIAPWVIRLALDTYAGTQPTLQRKAIEASLQELYDLRGTAMPPLPTQRILPPLADTPSTQDLAGRVAWFLETQKLQRDFSHKPDSIGQQGLLIMGPKARGKDDVVRQVLEQAGRDYIHLNANPQDLAGLRAALADAYRNGKVLLISEINLIADILDAEMNRLLTGQHEIADRVPGFTLIATANPPENYPGRRPISEALLNRMQCLRVEPYAQDELPLIAQARARALRERKSANWPLRFAMRSNVRPDQRAVDAIVMLHEDLCNRLGDLPKPGVREIGRVLEKLALHPRMSPQEAFDIVYFGHERKLKRRAANVRPTATATAPERGALEKLMRQVLALAHPGGKTAPDILVDAALPANIPVVYDSAAHCVRYAPDQPPARLWTGLLELEFTQTSYGLQPAPMAKTMDPTVSGNSGVGAAAEEGTQGRVWNEGSLRTYLTESRTTIGRVPYPASSPTAHALNDDAVPATGSKRIHFFQLATAADPDQPGRRRLYLPVTEQTMRPSGVSLGGRRITELHPTGDGYWYVDAENRHVVADVRYGMTSVEGATPPAPGKLPGRLELSFGPLLQQILKPIQELSEGPLDQQKIQKIAMDLCNIFKNKRYFKYSDEDAQELKSREHDVKRYCERFLRVRKGVCTEFATTLAVLLEQFGIRARLCHGYTTKHAEISRQSHSWVEYSDGEKWHVIDPTPAADTGSARGPASENETENIWCYKHDVFFDSTVLQEMKAQLQRLNLEYWPMARSGETFNNSHGELKAERMLEGLPNFLRDPAVTSEPKTRALVIEALPEFADTEARNQFGLFMSVVLRALQECGVELRFYSQEGELTRVEHVGDLNDIGNATDRNPAELDDNVKVVGKHDMAFYEQVLDIYYEALLKRNNVDANVESAVKDTVVTDIFLHFSISARQSLPMQLTVLKHVLNITTQDIDMCLKDNLWQNPSLGKALLSTATKLTIDSDTSSKTILMKQFDTLMETTANSMELTSGDRLYAIGMLTSMLKDGRSTYGDWALDKIFRLCEGGSDLRDLGERKQSGVGIILKNLLLSIALGDHSTDVEKILVIFKAMPEQHHELPQARRMQIGTIWDWASAQMNNRFKPSTSATFLAELRRVFGADFDR